MWKNVVYLMVSCSSRDERKNGKMKRCSKREKERQREIDTQTHCRKIEIERKRERKEKCENVSVSRETTVSDLTDVQDNYINRVLQEINGNQHTLDHRQRKMKLYWTKCLP